jgi:hypothetical protein
MRKSLTALVAAATIAVTLAAGTTDASAQWRRWGWGLGAGIIGGAIIASAITRPYYYGYPYAYGYPAYAYAPAPVYYGYYAPAPVVYSYYAPGPYLYGCWRWRYRYRYRVC